MPIRTRFNEYISKFEDDFAKEYAIRRPSYPTELFAWLASVAPSNETCWDVGTGSGQVAVGLADHFAKVYASDTNERLLAHAKTHDRVEYNTWPAEEPELAGGSVDLVTVGMAVQWFDLDRFYAAVRRMLRPNGVLAAFSFFFFEVEPELDRRVKEWYFGPLQKHVPPEIEILHNNYRDLPFPFERIESPSLHLRTEWPVEDMIAFLAQWGMVKAATAAGSDPLSEITPHLRERWGTGQREIQWPLTLIAARP